MGLRTVNAIRTAMLGMLLFPGIITAAYGHPIAIAHVDRHNDAALDLARERRVAALGYRLALSARNDCADPAAMTGWVLHDIAAYAQQDRNSVQAAYGLSTGFGIRSVVPGSAADRAGIRTNDVIISAGSVVSDRFEQALLSGGATALRTDRFNLALATMPPPIAVTLVRNGARLTVYVSPDHGCGGFFVVSNEHGVNAWSDGQGVAVTAQLVDMATDDSMLAFILAHEMAHNLLHHGEMVSPAGRWLAGIGIGAKKARANEEAADVLAVTLVGDAGFDPSGGISMLRKVEASGRVGNTVSHPGISRRIAKIEQAIAAWHLQQAKPAN